MNEGLSAIADEVSSAARVLPAGVLRALVEAFESCTDSQWPQLRLKALQVSAQPRFRSPIEKLLRVWHDRAPDVGAQSMALALLSAAAAVEHERDKESVELVWTGPDVQTIPLRRTDQVLLQVIDEAQRSLLVVSFAVYRARTVAEAIVRASERGVEVCICLEAPESGSESVGYDTIQALGENVRRAASIYVWPRASRPTDPRGRAGSLHVKCAVADDSLLFITSANLTEYAMSLNMELGVLIRGGRLAEMVAMHFDRLIATGMLRKHT